MLTSADVLLGFSCGFSLKVKSTWTDAFTLEKVLIVFDLLVTLSRLKNTRAAFSSSKPSPMSAIWNNSDGVRVMINCQSVSASGFHLQKAEALRKN